MSSNDWLPDRAYRRRCLYFRVILAATAAASGLPASVPICQWHPISLCALAAYTSAGPARFPVSPTVRLRDRPRRCRAGDPPVYAEGYSGR